MQEKPVQSKNLLYFSIMNAHPTILAMRKTEHHFATTVRVFLIFWTPISVVSYIRCAKETVDLQMDEEKQPLASLASRHCGSLNENDPYRLLGVVLLGGVALLSFSKK